MSNPKQQVHPLPQAWREAWLSATDKRPHHTSDDPHYRDPKSARELAALKPVLIAAFEASLPPFAADWAAARARARLGRERLDAGRGDPDERGEEQRTRFWLDGLGQARAVSHAFERLVAGAAEVGLAQELPDLLAKADGLPDRRGFARLLLIAARGSGSGSILGSRERDALGARLAADDPAVLSLWSRWRAACAGNDQASGEPLEIDLARDELRLAGTLADLLAAAAKRPATAPAAATLCSRAIAAARLAESDEAMRDLGASVAQSLKRSYASFGPAQEPLRAIFPVKFWLGARHEVGAASKLGAWIFEGLAAEARAQPSGEIRRDLGALAWAAFDRKERDAFEAAFPGGSVEAIEALRARPFGDFGVDASLDEAAHDIGEPKAAWLLPAFAKAGAPLPPKGAGYGESAPFRKWIRENPGAACDALLAANAKIEARALARAIRESGAAPAKPAKAKAPRL